ncbi:MAG: beta-ketoacyl-ACP synthase 3 [Spirochaetales bacterium]|nr:beta-ketoacyl-ACP synthase 3 [Spirochaetales bacterium]
MYAARQIDAIEESYTKRGEAFFHVSGGGHEATAALALHLKPQDWLHCHYRDKAMMLARGMKGVEFFHALFNKKQSHSLGRQMNAHMSAPELNILSLVGPVGNSALQSVGVAEAVRDAEGAPVVLSALGDGMSQQGEVLESIAQAVRASAPVLFLVENNKYAISTKTEGKTFYQHPDGDVDSFYGIPITRIDGKNAVESYRVFGRIVDKMRNTRKPEIVIFNVERLSNHTNADDQRVYRTAEEIEAVKQSADPVAILRKELLDRGIAEKDLQDYETACQNELKTQAREAQLGPEPEPVHDALRPLPPELTSIPGGQPPKDPAGTERTMIEAMRDILDLRMADDDKVYLFGEDLEDPKGDVFGVTKGLSKKYPGRVVNSPLSESSILGLSIGQALTGKHPVAFLQFADFLPLAYNQIISELGSMYWRSGGNWQVPVIVMISCGGYKPGLGPFHASSNEGIAAHTPGVDVFMPSNAEDAAGMLQSAFASMRPTLFFYPKNLLNNRSRATTADIRTLRAPIGKARFLTHGQDITLVGWGNTTEHCLLAAGALEKAGISAEVIDLRSIVPWDIEGVVASAEKTGKLLVVHEDTHTAGMGAEIVATVTEKASKEVAVRRVTRGDTYVPCNFENQLEVLPSYKRVLETAVGMFGGTVSWEQIAQREAGFNYIDAIGSSPSDEQVTVVEWHIKPGDRIQEGDLVADLEADKAAIELKSPVGGTVLELIVEEGNTVKVGEPLAKLENGGEDAKIKPVTKEEPGIPVISGIQKEQNITPVPAAAKTTEEHVVGIIGVAGATGSRLVNNEEISAMCPTWSPEDIVKRTGIHSRNWITEDETALTLAVSAATKLFKRTGTTIQDIDYIICSTGTPVHLTPTLATLVQHELAKGHTGVTCPAVDINAACSGYMYALQQAYDYLTNCPDHRVLVITGDVLSNRLDTSDPNTAPIFGDAATATLVAGPAWKDRFTARVYRPILSAEGEDGEILRIPMDIQQPIYMDGVKVYGKAVIAMIDILKKAAEHARLTLDQLDLIVPHQANQRIINAIRQRLDLKKERIFSNIRELGNTSSSTIPLCLETLFAQTRTRMRLGLTAFGGGFTFGGGIMEIL